MESLARLAALFALLSSLAACERRAATTAENPRQEEISLVGTTRTLRCGAPSSVEHSERVEACRVLTDFNDAQSFNVWPAANATDVWVGREYRGSSDHEVSDLGAFLLVRLTPGAPTQDLVANYRLRREDVLPYTARDLPFTRYPNPTDSVLGVERARQEYASLTSLLDALAHDRAPEAQTVTWLRGFESDPAGLRTMRGPAAVMHTTGPSLRLYPGLYGYVRVARDGKRMLVAFPNGAAELWRLPSAS